ncbi:MAG: adenosine kinase [Alphaproteobacteria bacterium]|nr:adenosine kinase [Alphaproteobacteria bacterium]MBE6467409.1 adenosine kinase [Alphaproteobacteria bacterium]
MIKQTEIATYYDVVGIGNAIVDVLAKVGDRFLTERNLPKGCMTLLNAQDAGKIYADIVPECQVSGGSAANTVAGLASLGGAPAFIGKVHDDLLGQEFTKDIGSAGIDFFTAPLKEGPMTGRSIVLVTPDAQRSMFTYLGANTYLSEEDIDENIIKASRITYIEGYILDYDNGINIAKKAAEIAHKYNRQVAYTLSDICCIKDKEDILLEFIKENVDILFANEAEIKALFKGEDFYNCLDLIKPHVEIAAITRSSKGSAIVNGRTTTFVEAEVVDNVVDTTGAGDLYAAGFLYGMTQGRSLGTCAIIGSIAAAEIISHYGARPEISLRGMVRNKLLSYGKRA